MPFQSITIPVCAGVLTNQTQPDGLVALSCSVSWATSTGIIIDPSYQAQLALMLDQSGIDWSVSMDILSYSIGFWLIGAVFGAIYNVVRRARGR